MAERIVLASDGGVASQAAQAWVIDRARHRTIEVEVVTVEELDWLPVGADESLYRRKYTDNLEAAQEFLSHRRGISFVATALLAGDPATALMDAASHADLLVIGSPLNSEGTGVLHGTLALRLAARTATRMAIVPAGWEPNGGGVVVGVDEDESSDSAVLVAASEAGKAGDKLLMVHSWALPAPFSILDAMIKTSYPTLEKLHREILTNAAKRATGEVPRLEVHKALRFGRAAEMLADAAKNQALIVVGTHRASRLEHLFLGSVAHDVLLSAPTPVMVVPNLIEPSRT